MSYSGRGDGFQNVSFSGRERDGPTPRADGFPASVRRDTSESVTASDDAFLPQAQAGTRSPPRYPPHVTIGETPHREGPPGLPVVRDYYDHTPDGSPNTDFKKKGQETPGSASGRPTRSRHSSWDLLSGLRKIEHGYEEFDSRNASQAHLQYAEGDIPRNKLARLYNYLINVSIVTRWILFIVPIMGLLWIPGILGLTAYPDAHIWNVPLLWWSIWLSVVWGGWWGSLAAARMLPVFVKNTVSVVAVGTRRYVDWLAALHRYVAFFAWTIVIWVAFQPLIDKRSDGPEAAQIGTVANLLFAFLVCAGALLFEKFSIQWIAGKFHERSYAERIADQKAAIKVMTTLYARSSNVARSDTLRDNMGHAPKKSVVDPSKMFKRAIKGVRNVATTTTTALGNVASEIAGSRVLQPNSPEAMVMTALTSPNKSRLLARRLYYSFKKPDRDYLLVEDIAMFFPNHDLAMQAFALFDKDNNGDATRDELEMAIIECHREQLSIEHSMSDLDSAVGRLDNILMSLWVIIAILVIAVALEAQLATLITSAGTLVLGLSWLIGGSLQEVLTSIIFLFVKHPYDVGDVVTIDGDSMTCREIRLLSSVFLDKNNCAVQVSHLVLTAKFIHNMRRSPLMSETITFDVAYGTSFEQVEELRKKMLKFVESERRDFLPSFDVAVIDFPDQAKLTLSADIKYKSNWQQGAVKVKRRNKWMCALKDCLSELKIFGSKGDPGATPAPSRFTKVPWEKVDAEDKQKEASKRQATLGAPRLPRADYSFSDKDAIILDSNNNVFGESEELHHHNPVQPGAQGLHPQHGQKSSTPESSTAATSSSRMPDGAVALEMEEFEMAGVPGV